VWRSRPLATVVACTTAFVSVGLFLLARDLPAGPYADDRGDDPEPG
jgi:hypothetical protein